jgi:hypothetical protein
MANPKGLGEGGFIFGERGRRVWFLVWSFS